MHRTKSGTGRLPLLKLQILWALSKSSMNGKSVVERVSSMRRKRIAHPNIYTSLRKLEKDGMVKSEKRGREVVWSITSKGSKKLEEMAIFLLQSMDGLIEELKCSRCDRICK